jgi:hypothetical protein
LEKFYGSPFSNFEGEGVAFTPQEPVSTSTTTTPTAICVCAWNYPDIRDSNHFHLELPSQQKDKKKSWNNFRRMLVPIFLRPSSCWRITSQQKNFCFNPENFILTIYCTKNELFKKIVNTRKILSITTVKPLLSTSTAILKSSFQFLYHKSTSEQRPPVNNGHKFWVSRGWSLYTYLTALVLFYFK